MGKFKLGDKVQYVHVVGHRYLHGAEARFNGLKGTVVHFNGKTGYLDNDNVGVEFDEDIRGHDCHGNGKRGYCRYFDEELLKLVDDEEEKSIIRWYKDGKLVKEQKRDRLFVGDEVEIISGQNKGMIGEITKTIGGDLYRVRIEEEPPFVWDFFDFEIKLREKVNPKERIRWYKDGKLESMITSFDDFRNL